MTFLENINKRTGLLIFSLMALMIYFIFFHRLDSFQIRTWDESIYAVNSFEMMERGSLLTPYFNGTVDDFAGKPPLFYWFQMVFIKLLGFSELSVRIPSAIFGALTAILCFAFIRKYFSFSFALISFLVLISAKGFAGFHSARTGDMDAALTFGVTGLSLFLFNYVQSGKSIHLLLSFGFLAFAFFTKSIAALFILPVLVAYVLIRKRNILKDRALWLGLIVFSGLVASFLYIREKEIPGYIASNFLRDFTRGGSILYADHAKPFDFYFNNLFNDRFPFFILFVIPAVFFAFKEENKKLKDFILLNLASSVFVLLILSIAKSKCYWYDTQILPMLSILSAYSLWRIFGTIESNLSRQAVAGILITVFIFPVYFACKRSYNNDLADDGLRRYEIISEYLHKNKTSDKFEKISVVTDQTAPVLFYKYCYQSLNKEIKIANPEKLETETILLTADDSAKKIISTHYEYEILEKYREATIYKIKQSKLS